jgi:hypothetical protein
MSKSVENVVERFGQYVNGQIVITWNTEQTAGQFLEIRSQGGVDDNPEFSIGEFVEYVRSNTSDVIQNILESFGQVGLEKEIFILTEDGEVVEDVE